VLAKAQLNARCWLAKSLHACIFFSMERNNACSLLLLAKKAAGSFQ